MPPHVPGRIDAGQQNGGHARNLDLVERLTP
jgi:hypothetical protein